MRVVIDTVLEHLEGDTRDRKLFNAGVAHAISKRWVDNYRVTDDEFFAELMQHPKIKGEPVDPHGEGCNMTTSRAPDQITHSPTAPSRPRSQEM